jgi:hypothetical protein
MSVILQKQGINYMIHLEKLIQIHLAKWFFNLCFMVPRDIMGYHSSLAANKVPLLLTCYNYKIKLENKFWLKNFLIVRAHGIIQSLSANTGKVP